MNGEYWCVMKLQKFADMRLEPRGLRVALEARLLPPADDDPPAFLPVFETREAAVAWNGGEDHIALMRLVEPAVPA